MPRTLPNRRIPRHHLAPHRPSRSSQTGTPPLRTSDLVLAVLGVTFLGGLALMAAFALATGAAAP